MRVVGVFAGKGPQARVLDRAVIVTDDLPRLVTLGFQGEDGQT